MKRKLDISTLWGAPAKEQIQLTRWQCFCLGAATAYSTIILYCIINPIKP
jgi:hypothetical protein